MKDIKDILKSGEEAYDNNEWIKLQKKLDVHLPIKTSKTSKTFLSYGNIIIFSIISSIIISFVFFVLLKKDNTKISENTKFTKNTNVVNYNKTTEENSAKTLKNTFKSNIILKNKSKVDNKFISVIASNSNDEVEVSSKKEIEGRKSIDSKVKNTENYDKKDVISEDLLDKYIPIIIEKQICINKEFSIQNNNINNIEIVNDEEIVLTVNSNNIKKLKFIKPGIYNIFYNKKVVQSFEIIQERNIYIEVSNEIIYDNGLPIIELKSKDFNNDLFWTSTKGIISEQKAQTQLFCFQKGNYEISINSKTNSCFNVNNESIYVQEEYNLLATNAFIPSSPNPKNQTFMPEALKLRIVEFELVVYDSKDQHIVFSSQASENAWNGIDVKTGNLVPSNVLYLWKVKLKNPIKGEKSEYNGTIIRL